jgi:hypothetical protein
VVEARRHIELWHRGWYNSGMRTVRKITVHVSDDLMKRAQQETGEGVTETVRRGLRLVAASSAYEHLRNLRGSIRLEVDLDELRAARR